MMKSIIDITVLFSIFIFISSCNNRIIKLKSTYDTTAYFVQKMEKADIYMPKKDVLILCRTKIQSEPTEKQKTLLRIIERFEKNNFKLYEYPFDEKKIQNEDEFEAWFLISLSIDYDLLKKGKVKVYNKITNLYETKIKYHFKKDKLGNSYAFFRFSNNIEFFFKHLSLGE